MLTDPNALPANHWIWSAFDELNTRHFGGRLERPQQILRMKSETFQARAVNHRGVRLIWIDSDSIDTDRPKAEDSLIHEMIHHELAASAEGDSDQEHGQRFVARADEIGKALGLMPCNLPGATPDQVREWARLWPKVQREASTTPVLPFDEAVDSEKPVVLVDGHTSEAARQASAKLHAWYHSGKLPMYAHTVQQNLDEGRAGGDCCHNNILALAADLWKLPPSDHKDWSIRVGDRGERRPHSWMEFGDAAIDATFNLLVVSTSEFHRTRAKVIKSQGFSGAKAWKQYLLTLKALGLVSPRTG